MKKVWLTFEDRFVNFPLNKTQHSSRGLLHLQYSVESAIIQQLSDILQIIILLYNIKN